MLLGVSGAGKSTLVNRLVGAERLPTADVRADGKGRHTTTHRALVPLEGGAVLIDTPGLRNVAVWDAGVGEAFADVTEIAAGCRFADCTHEHEPGCAVRSALNDGRLDCVRWESYRRLRAGREAFEARRRASSGARRRG